MDKRGSFEVGEFVVYPAHGVGRLVDIENHEIGGTTVGLYVINFDKDHMVLRLPVEKAIAAGLRGLSGKEEMQAALKMLAVKTKKKKTMWSRRAQEYEAKINSGTVGSLADVIRELYICQVSGEQSYSERQIYQTAMERFVRELSLIEDIDEEEASSRVQSFLNVA
ncbi:MAG: CarD family transcriptional regulator [Holosporales bacterium]|nr:CarD family transcriptional regulator [Holosporales bacterium]